MRNQNQDPKTTSISQAEQETKNHEPEPGENHWLGRIRNQELAGTIGIKMDQESETGEKPRTCEPKVRPSKLPKSRKLATNMTSNKTYAARCRRLILSCMCTLDIVGFVEKMQDSSNQRFQACDISALTEELICFIIVVFVLRN